MTAKLRLLAGVDEATRLFIESAHADAELADACLTRFTLLMLLALLGRLATFGSMGFAVLVMFCYYEADYLPTFGVALLVALVNVLAWPRPDVRLHTHGRSGFFHACVRACVAHPEHPDVQYGCLLQLGSAMSDGRQGKGDGKAGPSTASERIRKAGGATAACAALKAHPRHEGIRLEGMALLATLSFQSEESAEAALAAGAPAAILGALEAEGVAEDAQTQAAIALGNLTKSAEAAAALQRALGGLAPAHWARVLGVFAHHPAPEIGTAIRELFEALGAISRSGATPRKAGASPMEQIPDAPGHAPGPDG